MAIVITLIYLNFLYMRKTWKPEKYRKSVLVDMLKWSHLKYSWRTYSICNIYNNYFNNFRMLPLTLCQFQLNVILQTKQSAKIKKMVFQVFDKIFFITIEKLALSLRTNANRINLKILLFSFSYFLLPRHGRYFNLRSAWVM